MSFRHPFVTDFIYQAGEGNKAANKEIADILARHTKLGLKETVGADGMGYYTGIFWGSGVAASIYDEIESMIYELGQATKIPFRLTIMYESGPVVTYEIQPQE